MKNINIGQTGIITMTRGRGTLPVRIKVVSTKPIFKRLDVLVQAIDGKDAIWVQEGYIKWDKSL